MKWTKTKTTVTVGIAILMVVAVAMVVKWQFPQVKDSFFDPDTDKLRLLPANLVVVRPTHFPHSTSKIRHVHDDDGEPITRTLGRDVSLRDAIAEAYDCNPARVVLPPDAPEGGFDFLVTTTADTREHLQAAIAKKLDYAAHRETRDTDVLVLKVEDSNLPGLTVSADGEKADAVYKDGKLYFKHQQLSVMLGGLSEGLKQPVLDQTGLTNCYDFSVVWNPAIQQKMQNGTFNADSVQKVLGGWGLRLEPDTAPVEMFVVEKAR
jgi:uncharacterized protein (TIGR03435 family)